MQWKTLGVTALVSFVVFVGAMAIEARWHPIGKVVGK
jgi:hypothetical protein